MIAHTTLPVSDYRKSKAFYVQALAPLGYENNMESAEAAGFSDYEIEAFCKRLPAVRHDRALYDPDRERILS